MVSQAQAKMSLDPYSDVIFDVEKQGLSSAEISACFSHQRRGVEEETNWISAQDFALALPWNVRFVTVSALISYIIKLVEIVYNSYLQTKSFDIKCSKFYFLFISLIYLTVTI